ncbi:MAG: hypothetical protein JO006_18495 [Paucibacter sp.]|nr:hypothetical protein [Roseateles sp.]
MGSRSTLTQTTLTLICALAGMASLSVTPCEAEPVVIVNLKNHESLSPATIKQLFLERVETFPSGAVAFPVESLASQKEFSERFLQMTPESLNAYWARLLFTGQAKPLKKLAKDEDVIKFVRDNANAIGYVDSENVVSSVRVLAQ